MLNARLPRAADLQRARVEVAELERKRHRLRSEEALARLQALPRPVLRDREEASAERHPPGGVAAEVAVGLWQRVVGRVQDGIAAMTPVDAPLPALGQLDG